MNQFSFLLHFFFAGAPLTTDAFGSTDRGRSSITGGAGST
jgi:hypothetical protein